MAIPTADYNIATVGELIDAAFGDAHTNVVHHKLVQAILFLLANQLRVLQRRVYVFTDPVASEENDTTLLVSEVTLHSMEKSQKKKNPEKPHVQHKPAAASKKSAKSSKDTPQDHVKTLDDYELQRERELRLINQRADSREEQKRPPTPMRSLDSMEAKHEKLLVVERVSSEEAKIRAARERTGARQRSDTVLSIVTQEQFQALTTTVRKLQQIFKGVHENPDFPENAQLMLELRKGASLTDAMSALMLSARLEAAEKTLEKLISLVTDLAIKSGHHIEGEKEMHVLFEGQTGDEKSDIPSEQAKVKQPAKTGDDKGNPTEGLSSTISAETYKIYETKKSKSIVGGPVLEEEKPVDAVCFGELDAALNGLYDTIMKEVDEKVKQNTTSSNNAYRMVKTLETKLDATHNLAEKMTELQTAVTAYTGRINNLDKSLTSQMINYQEELTQMQHDLENGLENMADVLANTGGDATAVAELNTHFNEIQYAIESSIIKQKELRDAQRDMSDELDAIKKQIELLYETKSDREEVEDAMRDKAGLKDLNGMVYSEQFDAIRGEHQKQIGAAYDKFNSQELVWQKIIDDLERDLYDKADTVQVVFLRDEINENLNALNQKIKFIMDIVGEPSAAAVSKKIHRDTACISCCTPAHLDVEQSTVPKLPALRPPAIGAEDEVPKEDGKCYPGYRIPHPIDPRAHVCHRWCGGSHTVLNKLSRAPPGMIITSPHRLNTELGTDGKLYAVDVSEERKPCSQCGRTSPVDNNKESFHRQAPPKNEERFSDMTPPDYFPPTYTSMMTGSSMTPMFDD